MQIFEEEQADFIQSNKQIAPPFQEKKPYFQDDAYLQYQIENAPIDRFEPHIRNKQDPGNYSLAYSNWITVQQQDTNQLSLYDNVLAHEILDFELYCLRLKKA